MLNELGVLSDDLRVQMTVPRRLVERRCCLVAFLRGLFLGCGSISAPGAPVHVEFTVEDEGFAEQVQRLLARLDLPFTLTRRERNVACYTKRSADGRRPARRARRPRRVPALGGARGARHGARERQPARQLRRGQRAPGGGGRRRQAAAACARSWPRPRGRTLPAQLREVAELRVEYPYLSLAELAAAADPPLSRSALNHRLRRLAALADVAAAGELRGRRAARRPLTHMLRAARMVSSPSRYV